MNVCPPYDQDAVGVAEQTVGAWFECVNMFNRPT